MVGKAKFEDLSSESKTTNGVGSAYGDGSYINMSPYQSPVNDPVVINTIGGNIEQQKILQLSQQNPPVYPHPIRLSLSLLLPCRPPQWV